MMEMKMPAENIAPIYKIQAVKCTICTNFIMPEHISGENTQLF